MKPFGCAIIASVTIVVVWAPGIEKRPKMNLSLTLLQWAAGFSFINPTKYMYIKISYCVLKDAKLVWSSSRSFSDVTILGDKPKRTAEKRPRVWDELL